MKYKKVTLKPEEKIILELRGLYEEYGYKKYKMSKFEEYSLYANNKEFLAGDKVLTFTDLDGRLMALKPDVTLSIIKNTKDEDTQKFYYMENVYRESEGSSTFKEISQMGLEFIGKTDVSDITQVVALAGETLNIVNRNFILEVSHMAFTEEFLKTMRLSQETYMHLLKLIRNKNTDGIEKVGNKVGIAADEIKKLCQITRLYGGFQETIKEARKIAVNKKMEEALSELEEIYSGLKALDADKNVQIDFSMVNDIDYYNGVIFKGYLRGLPGSVLAGGQYDRAMNLLGKKAGGLGFALYLDEIAGLNMEKEKEDKGIITIALPKGRLGDKVYDILSKAGYDCPEYNDKNRKLVIENNNVRYILVKPSDVAVYVQHHAADIGIVGKDILLETMPDVYELKDLDIGKCRMAVAAPKGYEEDTEKTLIVATKYVNVAKKFYQEKNRDIEIIKLNGSIELGPILGLSHVIVDIVETGNTLRENNLEVIEEFKQISARLIANKSSYKFKNETITNIVESLGEKSE